MTANLKNVGDSSNRLTTGGSASGSPRLQVPAEDYLAQQDPTFDPVAWLELLAEQKLRIARVAGVDPSKVTIRVGRH